MSNESHNNSAGHHEYDPVLFPDLIACKVMPAVDDEFTEVEVSDAESNANIYKVHPGAVRKTNMPQIVGAVRQQSQMPSDIVKKFEEDIALGLLSCRVVEQTERGGLSRIALPTVGEATALTVLTQRLGRKL
jgi:hypothetical protein